MNFKAALVIVLMSVASVTSFAGQVYQVHTFGGERRIQSEDVMADTSVNVVQTPCKIPGPDSMFGMRYDTNGVWKQVFTGNADASFHVEIVNQRYDWSTPGTGWSEYRFEVTAKIVVNGTPMILKGSATRRVGLRFRSAIRQVTELAIIDLARQVKAVRNP